MKKWFCLLMLIIIAIVSIGCNSKRKLFLLNWGDYIDEELVDEFEEIYNVRVINDPVDSNESMYSRLKDKVSPYDIIFPSDYMIEKMHNENLLKKIDYTQLANYSDGMFVDELEEIMATDLCKTYQDYYIPYFWGALGIMYNENKEGVKEAVEEHGFKVFFEQNLLPKGSKVGMYNASRDAFAAAQLYLGYSLNTKNEEELKNCADLLRKTNFSAWGTDDLKKSVAVGNLDVALVYSGDFFDMWYSYDENEKEINFNMYVPTTANNVFFDAIVIPISSHATDLAYKFIDFMIDHEKSMQNALYVGYCPTIQGVYDAILEDEEMAEIVEMDAYHPTLVVKGAKEKAEVYANLGKETYEVVERLFNTVKQK